MKKATLPGGDTQPWYRQFWPWFLILLPASVVVASLYTVYIANRGADDLVVDEYYKDGLAINRQLEKEQRSLATGHQRQADTSPVTTSPSKSPARLMPHLSTCCCPIRWRPTATSP